VTALKSPGTWAPAAAAAAMLTVDDWDQKISRWAVRETPIFGSPQSAKDASDTLRSATHLAMMATALAGREEYTWGWRFQRLGVEEAGALINSNFTDILKEATNRERPDASDDASFPSSHASRSFNYATFASRNLDFMDLGDGTRRGLRIGFYTLAAGTAWARVEGQKHYPSDVLAGAALGHFMGLLLHDAFLGGNTDATVGVQLSRREASLSVRLEF
jgi:membrane-associated phospholipid phosphatase